MTPAPLGRLVVLTDRHQAAAAGHALEAVVDASATAGADTILFREKDLARPDRLDLGRRIAEVVAAAGGRLIVASDAELASALEADGVHAAQADPPMTQTGGAGLLRGRSCHDAAELRAAAGEGCDYVTISPVFASPSKPGHGPPLGATGAAALVGRATPELPAYALGGIDAERTAPCLQGGLVGVAVMGAVMSAADPAEATAELATITSGAKR